MVKSVISMICVFCILLGCSLYERDFVSRQFDELNVEFTELYKKAEEHTAVKDDVLAVQQNFINKKKYLHMFIPHTEIKELDLWLSEAVSLIENKKWEDAISKIEVLIELTEQIPKTFEISLENIL